MQSKRDRLIKGVLHMSSLLDKLPSVEDNKELDEKLMDIRVKLNLVLDEVISTTN